MIKSMTGYGRFEGVCKNKKILAEIRSVNHRFADYNIKVPRHYGFLEEKIKKFASGKIGRGKIDIYINVENVAEADKDVILNEAMAQNYISALRQLRDKFDLKDDISVSVVSQFSDIFQTERKQEDAEEIWECVKEGFEAALSEFVAMRQREGERLLADLVEKRNTMAELTEKICLLSPKSEAAYRERIYEKLNEILDGKGFDETRVLTEVALYADKIAVDEETVRLKSHFTEFDSIVSSPEPAGRKLDFLIQEINREINTIGSKACDLEIAKIVVSFKAELEKLREQVQNVE